MFIVFEKEGGLLSKGILSVVAAIELPTSTLLYIFF